MNSELRKYLNEVVALKDNSGFLNHKEAALLLAALDLAEASLAFPDGVWSRELGEEYARAKAAFRAASGKE